ncbi:alpha/beta-hydrolase [Russula earlei]|uniref:Alpha/beta-hydrolase n=1 Tax=Russula earlei TaxID=71964 RepID=A0ACC0U3D0_9AGAM|nr:alpha/beta-hydrolase [Russula earlei]
MSPPEPHTPSTSTSPCSFRPPPSTSFSPSSYPRISHNSPTRDALHFRLRHFHAVTPSAHVYFADVPLHSSLHTDAQPLSIPIAPIRTARPQSAEAFAEARALSMRGQSAALGWEEDEIPGPDVSKRNTLLLLAKMTSNAYVEPTSAEWYNLTDEWGIHAPVGWEPDDDGFRGYVFATDDNSTVVISIKGTSARLVRDGPTAEKDKLNDNLLFSCCCARINWSWTTVCDCYRSGWKCDQDCLENALIEESLFYPVGTNLYYNVTLMFPNANIWVIGHSLGGSLASLLGVTFGVPVVTFEPPGERMAAERLHLPSPPSTHHITHVWHTADPIAMGTCNGILSKLRDRGLCHGEPVCNHSVHFCFRTNEVTVFGVLGRCHMGNVIEYDTVTNLSWTVDVRTHAIAQVIEKVLSEPWAPAEEQGREVPQSKRQDDCVDCFKWEFGNYTSA